MYLVLSVYYSGKRRESDPLYRIAGELPNAAGANVRAYLEFKARGLKKKALGLGMAKSENYDEIQKTNALAEKILEISDKIEV